MREFFLKKPPEIRNPVPLEVRNAIVDLDYLSMHDLADFGVDYSQTRAYEASKDLVQNAEAVANFFFNTIRKPKQEKENIIYCLYYLALLLSTVSSEKKDLLDKISTNEETIDEIYHVTLKKFSRMERFRLRNILRSIENNMWVFRNI
jgi:hypothetical protein